MPKEATTQVNIRLTESLIVAVQQQAQAEGRNMADMYRTLLARGLSDNAGRVRTLVAELSREVNPD